MKSTNFYLLGLLGLKLSDVELELFAFEDVTVASTALSRSGRDSGEEATLAELFGEVGSNFGGLLSLGELDLGALGSLGDIKSGLFLSGELGVLLSGKGSSIVRLVPLSEGSAIDGDDGALDEGLGSDQLVVRGVVDNVDDSALSGSSLGGPGEGSLVESEGSVLDVSTSSSDGMNSLRLEGGHGLWSGLQESSLLSGHWPSAAGGTALM